MKQFFKYVLATIVGVLVLGFLMTVVFGGLFASAVASASKDKKKDISANSVLHLKFVAPVNDRPFEEVSFLEGFSGLDEVSNLGLQPTIKAIEKAKDDDEIRGIYLEINSLATGFANLEELQEAIADFKSSGKFVVANSDLLTQKAYGLIASADEIYLHPEGYMDFKGLAAQIQFYKGTLDKLGIEPMIFYAGKFKSATEPFRRKNMSEASKIQTKEFLEDIYTNYLESISEQRNISVAELRGIADNMKIRTPEDAVKYKLVTALKYDDEVRDILREKLGFDDDKKIEYISLKDYSEAKKITPKGKFSGDNRVAVLYAEGGIEMGNGDNGNSIKGEEYAEIVRKLRKNKKVKAVVLRVNSPGGSAFASDLIWREFELLKKEKPFIVSMGNYAASGGYYIACNSDKIYAEENTITGSIGVFGMMFNTQKLMEDKLGITTDGVATGKYSDFPNITKQWSAEEKEIMQVQIDRIYDNFIGKVAEGRQMTKEQVHEVAQGRVWSGEDAIDIGLVDEIGSLEDAISFAANKAEIDDFNVAYYPEHKDFFERFMENINIEASVEKKVKAELGQYAEPIEFLQSLEQLKQPQMRMPYELDIK